VPSVLRSPNGAYRLFSKALKPVAICGTTGGNGSMAPPNRYAVQLYSRSWPVVVRQYVFHLDPEPSSRGLIAALGYPLPTYNYDVH
jgi:hypothetical protein